MRSSAGAVVLIAVGLVLSTASPALGSDFELLDARSLGMGGAVRADAIGTTALYLNPSGIAMSKVYHIDSLYSFNDKYKMHLMGASVVDSVTSRLGMGLGYFFRWVGNGFKDSEVQVHNIVLGLAFPIIEKLSIGVNLHYIRSKVKNPSVAEPDGEAKPYGRNMNHFSLDAAATFHITPNIGLAVVGYNLTNLKSPLAPLMLGMSAFVKVAIVRVLFDVVLDWYSAVSYWDSSKPVAARYMAGVEVFVAEHFPIRGGYSYSDVTASHSVHGGLGYMAKLGSIEASFSYEVNSGLDNRNDFQLAITMKYFAF